MDDGPLDLTDRLAQLYEEGRELKNFLGSASPPALGEAVLQLPPKTRIQSGEWTRAWDGKVTAALHEPSDDVGQVAVASAAPGRSSDPSSHRAVQHDRRIASVRRQEARLSQGDHSRTWRGQASSPGYKLSKRYRFDLLMLSILATSVIGMPCLSAKRTVSRELSIRAFPCGVKRSLSVVLGLLQHRNYDRFVEIYRVADRHRCPHRSHCDQ